MSKPNTIRIAVWFLYIQMFFIVLNLVRVAQVAKEEIDKGQSSSVVTVILITVAILLIQAATVLFIKRRKRIPAILGATLSFFLLSGNIINMTLGIVILFTLFTRSSRDYFQNMAFAVPGAVAPAEAVDADDAVAEAEEPGSEAAPSVAPAASRPRTDPVVEIRPAGPEDAAAVHSLMMAAFEEYRAAVPPSSALAETAESVQEAMEAGQGAAILYEDDKPAAMVRYEISGETISFFRLSVLPSRRRRGYAKRLVKWVEQYGVSKGMNFIRCRVRQTVQNNVSMYQDIGYEIVDQELVVRPEGSVKTLTMEKKLGV